jgi:hypothetical protein
MFDPNYKSGVPCQLRMGGNTVEQPRDGGPSERQPYGRLYFLGVIGVKRVTCSSIVRSALSFISRRTRRVSHISRSQVVQDGRAKAASVFCH